jgi:hypothetical protein
MSKKTFKFIIETHDCLSSRRIAEYMAALEMLLGAPVKLISVVQDEPATERPNASPERPNMEG